MTNNSSIGQTILAALGSVVLTVTAVGAAVGPARAIETTPIHAPTQAASANV
jgi:hypothetical protein